MYPVSHVELLDEDYANSYSIVGSTKQIQYDDHLMDNTIIYRVSSSEDKFVQKLRRKEMEQKSDIFLHTSFKQGNTNKEEKVSKIVSAEKDTHCKGQSKKEMLVKGPDQIYQSLQKLHIKKRTVHLF